ncbi:MAG: amidohydrolase [Lachnospiraceae bacterium]|nr:amidohydrolase [Lachnospiraceae bacterium]
MNTGDIQKLVLEYKEYVIQRRREFHQNPEVSGKEFCTREILVRELKEMEVPYIRLSGTGIIAVIKGEKPGKNKILRADIDALPIQEDMENLKQKKECVSLNNGVCHACGHDAHMAILLGTMKVLLRIKDEIEGTVYCCFEEGEETNCGIGTMMDALKEYSIDSCFALHVYNGLDAGKVNVVPGPRMAGTVGIGLHIKGKSGHGSRPDQAINPIIPAAHIITQLNSAFMNQLNVEETVTLGIGMVRAGEATNVIPDEAYIGGSARFFNKEEGEKALEIIKKIAVNTAECHKCTVSFENRNSITPYPVVNDEGVALDVQGKIREICGDKVMEYCDKWYASECYSAYLNRYPGALGFLGIRNESYGSGAAHHNGKFDIDESVLTLGVCTEVAFIISGGESK